MNARTLVHVIESKPTSDGAGVKLRRSLGSQRGQYVDPFLMLDEQWATGAARLLGFVGALARERRTWVVAGDAFADWLTDPTAALRS